MERDITPDADGKLGDATAQTTALTPLLASQSDDGAEGHEHGSASSAMARPWRPELARWLLTLNPGRTQDEYAKAVGYFFDAPGAPQSLDLISADLLLAYRGALAMRAERARTARGARGPGAATAARLERLWGNAPGARRLAGEQESPRDGSGSSRPLSRLAPATVNLRLTALRQFLRFAIMRDSLSELTIERIQHALRRLPIERRRPYQILSEEEWPRFLAVARAPLTRSPDATPQQANADSSSGRPSPAPHSLWGSTRAQRARASQTAGIAAETASDGQAAQASPEPSAPQRARDGRTGARTAQRDYALVALALTTGLRAIELSLLDVGDLARERRDGEIEWWLTLPDEKTKGQRGGRTLPLAPVVVSVLLDYLRVTGRSYNLARDRDAPLFLALPNGPHVGISDPADAAAASSQAREKSEAYRLRPEQIRAVINRIETQWLATEDTHDGEASERRISPHALRHSAAIALLKGSNAAGRPPASVEHVRGWLGHFDIRTTQRYLDHLSSRDERRQFTIATNLGPNPASAGDQATSETSAASRAPAEPDSL